MTHKQFPMGTIWGNSSSIYELFQMTHPNIVKYIKTFLEGEWHNFLFGKCHYFTSEWAKSPNKEKRAK